MNPEKSEIKLAVLQVHGEKAEYKLEQSRLEIMSQETALQVLSIISKEFQKYTGEIELETRTNKLSIAQSIIAKKYVVRCADFVEAFTKGTEIKLQQNQGKMSAYRDITESLKNDRDDEKKKLDSFREAQTRLLEEEKLSSETIQNNEIDNKVKKHPVRMDVARSLGVDNKKKYK